VVCVFNFVRIRICWNDLAVLLNLSEMSIESYVLESLQDIIRRL
jgi:hypothetical protein